MCRMCPARNHLRFSCISVQVYKGWHFGRGNILGRRWGSNWWVRERVSKVKVKIWVKTEMFSISQSVPTWHFFCKVLSCNPHRLELSLSLVIYFWLPGVRMVWRGDEWHSFIKELLGCIILFKVHYEYAPVSAKLKCTTVSGRIASGHNFQFSIVTQLSPTFIW